MHLNQLLEENWRSWHSGGLSETTILESLSPEDTEVLIEWANRGETEEHQIKGIKKLVDAATWCICGTHSLLYHSREIREPELDETARALGIGRERLVKLILSSQKSLRQS